eukprot:2249311-Rhodomonas_salina.1
MHIIRILQTAVVSEPSFVHGSSLLHSVRSPPMRCPVLTLRRLLWCYARAVPCGVPSYAAVLRSRYAPSGTEIGHGATRFARASLST